MSTKTKYSPVKHHNNKVPEQRKNRNYYYPQPSNPAQSLFRGNLANNMKFGSKGQTISGYTRRELIYKDSSGNQQIAREEQFFNAGHRIRVRINKDKNDSRY